MKDLEIKCDTYAADKLTAVRFCKTVQLTLHAQGGRRPAVNLTPETAQQLVDWLTEWIEQSKLVCGWARLEVSRGGSCYVMRKSGVVLATCSSLEDAVAWVENLTAEVRNG